MTEFDLETKIKDLLSASRKVAIVPSITDGADSFSAALGIYRMLSEKGKECTILYSGAVPAGMENLTENVTISSSVGSRSLMVSIDYSGTDASKVNYNTENDVLYFYLTPVNGDFDLSKVRAEVTGPDFDLYITVGVKSPEDTGGLKQQLEAEIAKSKVINLDNDPQNTKFGTVYVVDSSMSGLSLLVLNKAPKWDLTLNAGSVRALGSAFIPK